MRKASWIFAAAAIFGLSGCLTNDLERGLVGAAAGALAADAIGVDPVIGAAAGGAFGATCDNYSNVCN